MYMEHTNGRMGKVYKNWQTQNRLVYGIYRTMVLLGIFLVLLCLYLGRECNGRNGLMEQYLLVKYYQGMWKLEVLNHMQ